MLVNGMQVQIYLIHQYYAAYIRRARKRSST